VPKQQGGDGESVIEARYVWRAVITTESESSGSSSSNRIATGIGDMGLPSKAIDRHQGMQSAYLRAFHGIPHAFGKHGCGTFPLD